MVAEDAWNNWPVTTRKLIAEMIGTSLLTFMGSLSFTFPESSGALGPACAHGLTLAFLILSLGHISGGHFNPVVTLSITLTGNMHIFLGLLYVLFQVFGGFLGAIYVQFAVNTETYCMIGGGSNTISSSHSSGINSFFLEAAMTFALVTTILNSAVDKEGRNQLAGFAIGLTLLSAICAGGDKTGASLNPARSFGPAVVFTIFRGTHGQYLGFPCSSIINVWDQEWYGQYFGTTVGGICASLTYLVFLASRDKRFLLKGKRPVENGVNGMQMTVGPYDCKQLIKQASQFRIIHESPLALDLKCFHAFGLMYFKFKTSTTNKKIERVQQDNIRKHATHGPLTCNISELWF